MVLKEYLDFKKIRFKSMKRPRLVLLIWSIPLILSPAFARQSNGDYNRENVFKALQEITLPASRGDSVNLAEMIHENRFTLIVMYRGVW